MWNGRQRLDVGAVADAGGLDHLGAGAACGLGAERRALVAVELDHREVERLGRLHDVLQRRVDEHADELRAAFADAGDLGGRGHLDPARGLRVEDQPDRPGARLERALGIGPTGEAAELDAGRGARHTHIVGRVSAAPSDPELNGQRPRAGA